MDWDYLYQILDEALDNARDDLPAGFSLRLELEEAAELPAGEMVMTVRVGVGRDG